MRDTILIVEDDPIIALDLKETLSGGGYHVPPPVASADDVPVMVSRYRPRLILMDIELNSFLDGIDAARRAVFQSSAKVIFLTAFPEKSIRDRAKQLNPSAYLVKPVSAKVLLEEVKKALG